MSSPKQSPSTRRETKAPEFISLETMNQAIVKCEYAVRGAIVKRAIEITKDLQSGKGKYPFKEVLECNVGNPQVLGQPPITFFRQVLSILTDPTLLNNTSIPEGARKRAKYYLEKVKSIGGYAPSPGYMFVRENVAKFFERRDGAPSNPESILLSNGASEAITMVIMSLIADSNCGLMLPLPQYPLYSATITVCSGKQVSYFLDEESGWQIKLEDLVKSYEDAKAKGIKVQGIVVINPGNPTGQILEEDAMKKIVEFAYERGLCILADEVYQQNIWSDTKKFIPFKKVIYNMPAPYNKVPVFSFGSCSKGFLGECGLRGGFMEMYNVDPEVQAQIQKYKTISLCSNTVGHIMVDLLVNPPTVEENGKEVFEQYNREKDEISSSLKRKAKAASKILNSMKNVQSQEIEGAMYCFPKIYFSKKVLEEAAKRKIPADLLYCLEALEHTGIATVEGTGFGQKKGTFHFRSTILIRPDDRFEEQLGKLKKFNDEFHEKYADKATPKL